VIIRGKADEIPGLSTEKYEEQLQQKERQFAQGFEVCISRITAWSIAMSIAGWTTMKVPKT